jgi:hypothetical protein
MLGFAIERSEVKDGAVIERYFLRGIKRFQFKDEGVAPGTPMPTSEHPIQSFQWGDYTAKPATTYRYKVVPVYGKPKLIELDDASATTVEISTEAEKGGNADDGQPRHDIYFNRGAAGSQAYARKFPDKPDETKPRSAQMLWLSRGLFEALDKFIRRAAGQDANDYKLRAMLYEFRYLPVGKAFGAAQLAGADVAIRYEAQSYKDDNEAMIAEAGIGDICQPQKSRAGIRHNKFIVLIHKDKPVADFRSFQCGTRHLGPRDRTAVPGLLGSAGKAKRHAQSPVSQESSSGSYTSAEIYAPERSDAHAL